MEFTCEEVGLALRNHDMHLEEALRGGVLLTYAINGYPLPPQHEFPLRLIVPDWYGMASVMFQHVPVVVS